MFIDPYTISYVFEVNEAAGKLPWECSEVKLICSM
jgi:hypothetical protein